MRFYASEKVLSVTRYNWNRLIPLLCRIKTEVVTVTRMANLTLFLLMVYVVTRIFLQGLIVSVAAFYCFSDGRTWGQHVWNNDHPFPMAWWVNILAHFDFLLICYLFQLTFKPLNHFSEISREITANELEVQVRRIWVWGYKFQTVSCFLVTSVG